MTLDRQTVIAGAGAQPVGAYAVDATGRATRPDPASTASIVDLCRLETDPEREVLASTVVTIDPATATTTQPAGVQSPDQRAVTVDVLPTLVLGRQYELVGPGKREAFTLDRVDASGLTLYAREPLRWQYSAGAIVQGLLAIVDFPAGVADDEDQLHYRTVFAVDWVFVGLGRARTAVTIERLSMSPIATVDDVLLIDTQLAAVHGDRSPLEPRLRQAERELRLELELRGVMPESLLDNGHAVQAVAWRAVELVYRTLGDAHMARADWACREADKWRHAVVTGYPPITTHEVGRRTDRVLPPTRKSAFTAA